MASLGLASGAAALTGLILGGGTADLVRVPISVLADAAVLAGAVAWDRRAARSASHRAFVPLAIDRGLDRILRGGRVAPDIRPMLRGARDLLLARGGQVAAVLTIVCLSPLLLIVGVGVDTPGLPAPEAGGAASPTWDALRGLWVVSRGDVLPNLADYVAHTAYQGTLSWGGVDGLPARGEVLAVPHYTYDPEAGEVVAGSRTVAVFGDTWLRSALAAPRPGSVDELLVAQGGPRRVRPSAPATEGARDPEPWRMAIALAIVSAFLVLGSRQLRPAHLAGITARSRLPVRGPGGALERRRQLPA